MDIFKYFLSFDQKYFLCFKGNYPFGPRKKRSNLEINLYGWETKSLLSWHFNSTIQCNVKSYIWYSIIKLEKVALALIYFTRRLRFVFNSDLFSAHTIRVIAKYTLKSIIGKTDLPRRVPKWVVQLSKFAIQYEPRTICPWWTRFMQIIPLDKLLSHVTCQLKE